MTEFPPIGDELRPRAKLKRHVDTPSTDDKVETNSRTIGQKWGAFTSSPQPAQLISVRGYIPLYLDDELSMEAAKRRVTKTFLIMEALAKAGYRIAQEDLIEDCRKKAIGQSGI